MGTKPKTGSKPTMGSGKNGDDITPHSATATGTKPARAALPHPDLTIEELRDAIENANDVVYTHDLEGDFNYTNANARKIFGFTKEETQCLNVRDILDEKELLKAKTSTADKLAGRPTQNPYLINVRGKNGHLITLELSTRLLYKDGKAVGVQGIGRDITERLRAEAALLESESRLRAITENAPCAIIIYQGEYLVYANPASVELTGFSMEELMSITPFWNLAAPDHREEVKRRAIARMKGKPVEEQFEFKILRKDGGERWLEFTAKSLQLGASTAALVLAVDITERKKAQQAVIQSEHLFRTLVESCSDMICILEIDGRIQYPSPAIERILGYKPEEVLGKSCFQFAHPDDREIMKTRLQERLTRETSIGPLEMRFQHKDGSWIPFEGVSNLIYEEGKIAGVLVSCRDVRERQQAENELRLSEERYRQVFERNLAGVFISTVEGKLLDCNQSFARIFGYESREAIMNSPARSLYLKEGDRSDFIARLRNAKMLTNIESKLRKQDGTPVWVLENVTHIEATANSPECIQGTLFDITERKEAEQAVMESESRFRAVADTASSAIYIHDNRNFLYVNRAAETISGYTAGELLMMDPFDLVHPADHELVQKRATQRMEGSSPFDRYEYRIRVKSGAVKWVDFSASTILFAGETAILGTAFDITERKRVEQMQRALFRIADRANVAEDLPEFFAAVHMIVSELMDARNFFIGLKDKATGLMSYPYFVDEHDPMPEADTTPQHGLTEYVLRSDKPVLVNSERMKSLQKQGEVNLIGSMFVDWMGAPLRSGNDVLGIIVAQSYSEDVRYGESELEMLNFVSQHVASAILRKRNQDALKASELRNRSLVQSAVYGIYRSNAEGNFLEVNPAMVSMLGYASKEELLALSMSRDVYIDPSDRARLISQYRPKTRIENVEVRWKRKDGKPITVRLSGRAIEQGSGAIDGFEMIAEDVTERRALEEQLRQSQKMEAVGRLAGGVAHDFNNLLTVIRGYSELMLEEFPAADPLRNEVEEIRKAADRAASLTRQLLAFSRQQVMAPKVLDLNSVVSNMERLLKRLLGEDIRLSSALGNDLGRVKADPNQIEQVIMNLAVNARDAMPKGGKLTIETANAELDESYTHEHIGARAGSYVMLAVSDTGTGMASDVKQRIFEPFYTTKEVGKGTGLGLSTVYGIVKQSDGYIWVYSEPGKGTSFKVYLPRVDAPADLRPAQSSEKPRHRGTETVLLVEDEDGVRALVRQVLNKHGYTVLEARHGGEALLHCERHGGEIDLLLTDVILEQMSGTELASRLASLRPKMKVLYISGYTDDAIVHHGVTHGTHFLQKPFTTEALARKIRQVLDESKPN